MIRLFLGVILLISFIPISYQELEDKSITSVKGDTKINLIFSDGVVTGKILYQNNSIIISENSKVIQKENRVLIFDRENNLKMFFRQLTDEKYFIILKIDDIRIRFIGIEDRVITQQRNLFEEMKSKQEVKEKTPKELQFLEKQKKAQKEFEMKLKRLENKQDNVTTGDSILTDYEKAKEQTGMGLVIDPKTIIKKNLPVPIKEKKIEVFLSVPHMTAWKEKLKYDVLVTDDAAQRYDSTYKAYIGDALKDVKVVGKILNPSGKVLQKVTGTTDKNGKYFGEYIIPDNSSTKGEYQLVVTATYTLNDKILKSDVSKVFFITYYDSGSSKKPTPIIESVPDAVVLEDPLIVNGINGTQIILKWDMPFDGNSPIKGYNIERTFNLDDVFEFIGFSKHPELTYTDPITENGTHFYRAVAINEMNANKDNPIYLWSNIVNTIITNATSIGKTMPNLLND